MKWSVVIRNVDITQRWLIGTIFLTLIVHEKIDKDLQGFHGILQSSDTQRLLHRIINQYSNHFFDPSCSFKINT
jgi:hypothetical protein